MDLSNDKSILKELNDSHWKDEYAETILTLWLKKLIEDPKIDDRSKAERVCKMAEGIRNKRPILVDKLMKWLSTK